MAIIDTLHYTGWPSTKVIPEKREVRVVARYITPAVYDISGKVGRLINLVIVFWLLYKYRGIWEYVGVRPSFGYVFWFLFNKIVPGPWARYLVRRQDYRSIRRQDNNQMTSVI